MSDFYANHFIPQIPPDLEFVPVSQIFAHDDIIEESVARFTHTLSMDWMLPGLPSTNRKVELALVSIIRFASGKVANEHFYLACKRGCVALARNYLPKRNSPCQCHTLP